MKLSVSQEYFHEISQVDWVSMLKVEVICYSKMLVNTYRTTQCHNSEDLKSKEEFLF